MSEEFKELSREELKQWMESDKDFLLVDTLGPESYAKHHLPGAEMIDAHKEDFLDKVLEKAGSKDKAIVVYCASFECQLSPKAAKALVQNDFTNVYDFAGGIKDWKDGGYELKGEEA